MIFSDVHPTLRRAYVGLVPFPLTLEAGDVIVVIVRVRTRLTTLQTSLAAGVTSSGVRFLLVRRMPGTITVRMGCSGLRVGFRTDEINDFVWVKLPQFAGVDLVVNSNRGPIGIKEGFIRWWERCHQCACIDSVFDVDAHFQHLLLQFLKFVKVLKYFVVFGTLEVEETELSISFYFRRNLPETLPQSIQDVFRGLGLARNVHKY